VLQAKINEQKESEGVNHNRRLANNQMKTKKANQQKKKTATQHKIINKRL
jgi:hypothetical protein